MVASLNLLRKSLKMSKNIFLQKFLQVLLYILLLLETGSLPIDIMAMERVVEYMLKVQKWEASKKIQKMHKSKVLCSGGCKI